jgi:hypothetical protein
VSGLEFMGAFTAAGRLSEPDAAAARPAATCVVERWNGAEWVETRLTWDGEAYV